MSGGEKTPKNSVFFLILSCVDFISFSKIFHQLEFEETVFSLLKLNIFDKGEGRFREHRRKESNSLAQNLLIQGYLLGFVEKFSQFN